MAVVINGTGSITGLTTALSTAQGGTNVTAAGTANNALISDGTNWLSGIPASLTLLNSGSTTVGTGTGVTYSSLTLTSYKYLLIHGAKIYNANASNMQLRSNTTNYVAFTGNIGTTQYGSFYSLINLTNGIGITGATAQGTTSTALDTGWSTSTTSLSFILGTAALAASQAFGTSGDIYIYGIK
jgi:hypothetical protein